MGLVGGDPHALWHWISKVPIHLCPHHELACKAGSLSPGACWELKDSPCTDVSVEIAIIKDTVREARARSQATVSLIPPLGN